MKFADSDVTSFEIELMSLELYNYFPVDPLHKIFRAVFTLPTITAYGVSGPRIKIQLNIS